MNFNKGDKMHTSEENLKIAEKIVKRLEQGEATARELCDLFNINADKLLWILLYAEKIKPIYEYEENKRIKYGILKTGEI